MKRATRRPSEWLKLLCKQWADENTELVEATDAKFMEYKPYLKGYITSQLLCRLCIPSWNPSSKKDGTDSSTMTRSASAASPDQPSFDFWAMLNIHDDFDKAYIIAQVERFCALYNIRGVDNGSLEAMTSIPETALPDAVAAAAAAAAAAAIRTNPSSQNTAVAAAAAAAMDASNPSAASTAAAAAALYGDMVPTEHSAAGVAAAAAAAANGGLLPQHFLTADATAAAVAAVAQQADVLKQQQLAKKQNAEVTRAQRLVKDAERALEYERKQNAKREMRRQNMLRKLEKQREREVQQHRKSAERLAREATREDRRNKKLALRMQRERFAMEQKEAALKRAAELVASNRVPIEITRGAAAAKAVAQQTLQQTGVPIGQPLYTPQTFPGQGVSTSVSQLALPDQQSPAAALATNSSELGAGTTADTSVLIASPAYNTVIHNDASSGAMKKQRSAIIVSTAMDLHQIVTHSKNLWAKYNAIAKEHNQKVNWITVAKELGIHVKVREKYARMHFRAEQRGFDWVKNGHWKIKDHPEIFVEPTLSEQKAKMPPPPPDVSRTVLISDVVMDPQQHLHHHHNIAVLQQEEDTNDPEDDHQYHETTTIQIGADEAAVAAAAAVVDAANLDMDATTTAAGVAATLTSEHASNLVPGPSSG
jgi:hypothetical protein